MLTRVIIAAAGLALATPCLAGSQTRTSRFEYDAQGQLIREIIEPGDSTLCLVTTYVPDSHGNPISATTRNCNGTSTSGVIEAPAPTGDPVFAPRTSGAEYAAGSDVNGAWIEGQFPTTVTNALFPSDTRQRETRTYDPRFGGALTLTGPNNLQTIWRYDGFGRKQSEQRADGTISTWFYERCADLAGACPSGAQYRVRVTATGAPTSSTYYDSFNREVRTETQGFNGTSSVLKDTQYDTLGRVASVMGPYYAGDTPPVRSFVYDNLGRVTQALDPQTPSGRVITLTVYNSVVTTTTWSTTVMVTNGYGSANMPGGVTQNRTTTKNSQGQVVQVKDTLNNTLGYTYDEFGNLKTTTDALGNVTSLLYDLRGRKKQTADPDMGTWRYDYNAASDLVRQTDAKNQVVTMQYDPLARMTNRTEPDLVSTWTYDNCTMGVGKLCQATASNGYSRTLAYDPKGRLQTLNATIGDAFPVNTTYVQPPSIHVGKVDTLTYPTGFGVRNVYNDFGYLSEVRVANPTASNDFPPDNTLLWHENAQTASGKVTSELLGNGLTQTRSFDPVDRMSSVVAGSVHNLSYTYDTLGNVTDRVDSVDGVTEHFVYDTLSRLTSDSGPGLITRSFDYNAVGNVIYKSDVGSGTYTYPASGANSVRPHAVSSISGTVSGISNPTFSYDPNGNLTSGLGRTLTYLSFNLPLTITGSAATYTYTYSPEHKRAKLVTQLATGTQTSIYLHPDAPATLLYEKEILPDHTEHKHYVNAGAQLVGVYITKSVYVGSDTKQMRYYHSDSLGSIVAVTNESGAPLERLAYEAFGKRRFPNGTADPNNTLFGVTTDRGFTRHEHLDELGLIHMNGRIYDPLLARFMTPDPTVPYQFNLQSFNRYSYARNNPLRTVDPSGFDEADGEAFESSSNGFAAFSDWLSQMWNATLATVKLAISDVSKDGASGSDPSSARNTPSIISKLPVVPPPVKPETPDTDLGKVANKTLQLADGGTAVAQSIKNWWEHSFDSRESATDFAMRLIQGWPVTGAGVAGAAGVVSKLGRSAAATGGAEVVRVGQAGEAAVRAAVDIGPKIAIEVAGRTRITDGLTSTAVTEVKNALSVSYTQQLRDLSEFAAGTDRLFNLYVRPGAKLSGPLRAAEEAGSLRIYEIPF